MSDLRTITKAIAGATAGAMGGVGTALITVPPDVVMPFWGYILVGVLNAAIGFAGVYFAPANRLSE